MLFNVAILVALLAVVEVTALPDMLPVIVFVKLLYPVKACGVPIVPAANCAYPVSERMAV